MSKMTQSSSSPDFNLRSLWCCFFASEGPCVFSDQCFLMSLARPLRLGFWCHGYNTEGTGTAIYESIGLPLFFCVHSCRPSNSIFGCFWRRRVHSRLTPCGMFCLPWHRHSGPHCDNSLSADTEDNHTCQVLTVNFPLPVSAKMS
jgi:hypothetical protein